MFRFVHYIFRITKSTVIAHCCRLQISVNSLNDISQDVKYNKGRVKNSGTTLKAEGRISCNFKTTLAIFSKCLQPFLHESRRDCKSTYIDTLILRKRSECKNCIINFTSLIEPLLLFTGTAIF